MATLDNYSIRPYPRSVHLSEYSQQVERRKSIQSFQFRPMQSKARKPKQCPGHHLMASKRCTKCLVECCAAALPSLVSTDAKTWDLRTARGRGETSERRRQSPDTAAILHPLIFAICPLLLNQYLNHFVINFAHFCSILTSAWLDLNSMNNAGNVKALEPRNRVAGCARRWVQYKI